MTYYPDDFELQELKGSAKLVTIGWLESGHSYKTGNVDCDIYKKLKFLMMDPWNPHTTWGNHTCSLCQFDGARGSTLLYVPYNGNVYVCPELIVHYIGCHNYLPPEYFINAINTCPDTHGQEYRNLLLANGGSVLISRNG
jgi:hypothetical protein